MNKRIRMAVLATLLLLMPVNATALDAFADATANETYGANLVPNGDFESGDIAWPNWTNIAIGQGGQHEGVMALKITGGFGVSGLDFGALEPGRMYRFGAWYKYENGEAGGNLKLTLGKSFSRQLDFNETDGSYHYAEIEFTAPEELTKLSNSNLTLVKWSNSDFYLDDVMLQKVSTAEELRKEAISPSFLHSIDNTETRVDLAWDAPQEKDGLTYTVYRDGKPIGQTSGVTYAADGLQAGQAYAFKVAAEKEGLLSFPTNTAAVQTSTPLPALTKAIYPGQIGVGLEGIGGRGFEFADAAKTLRAWSKPDGSAVVKTDADGWPLEDAATVFFDHRPVAAWLNEIDDPERRIPDISGTYKLSFKGKAVLGNMDPSSPFTIANQRYDEASGTTTADITLPQGGGLLYVSFTQTVGGVRDVKLMRPGYSADGGELFTREFVQALQPFGTLRFMDWLSTNNNNPSYPASTEWQDRKKPTDATQLEQNGTKGVAWEYLIALANEAHKDIWINIPAAASDDYVRELAMLLKEKLDPQLAIYVEYSNEVWNDLFSQQAYNKAAAIAEGGAGSDLSRYVMTSYFDDPNDASYAPEQRSWARHRVAKRVVDIGRTFQSVFGEDALNTRIRPVLSWFVLFPDQYEDMLNWVDKTYGDPRNFFYAIATAPYFNSSEASDAASKTEVLTAMQADSARRGLPEDGKMKLIDLAAQYGLHSFTYEGGPDSGGGSTINVANRIAAHRSERMGDLVTYDIGNNFLAKDGDMFMYFTLTSGYSRYGMWGATEDLFGGLQTPKYRALESMLGTNAEPFSDVPAGHFASEAVKTLYANGIVGSGDGRFQPNKALEAGELDDLSAKLSRFADARNGAEGTADAAASVPAMQAAAGGSGSSHAAVSRERLAAGLMRVYEAETGRTIKHPDAVRLQDGKQVSDGALASVEGAIVTGMMTADEGRFRPKASVSRAEAAVALAKLLGYIR
ncbi:S-layer homology domain-containing protein [Paenibacillus sp. UNC496MF]|uniref:carbohydrate binding domain-containing protein n=1 Tax=Paenibacillus sp. UNC496MF TaxID=1502753 RepID=UPI0008E26D28|nr:carbohydrate binding domain-containing protein [Paenibacillus sp. UNC496MF]SFJ31315.1 S-layer homology domain-containing protein [Paenibacillus sp. UNC496MF]